MPGRSANAWLKVWHWISQRPRNAWLVLLFLTVIIRLPYVLDDRQVIDESYYSTVGIEVLDGGQPYVSAVDRKPPLLFYSYSAFFWLVGKYNFVGLHVLSLLWACATMVVLYVIARRLFDWRVGIVAALFYSVFQPAGDYRNQAMNGEMLMNLPIVLALALVFMTGKRKLRPELLAAGALLAAAFLYKQPAAIAAVPMGMYLLLPSYRSSRGAHLGHSVANGAILTIGFAATLGLFSGWLHSVGILHDALFWTSRTDFVHGPTDPVYWKRLCIHGILYFVLPMAPLLACAVASMGTQARATLWKEHAPEFQALVLLLVFSWLGCAASGRFSSHHFIQLLPALCLLGARVLVAVWDGRLTYRFPLLRRKVLAWTSSIMFVGFTIAQTIAFQVRFHGGEAPVYVRSITQPGDRIFVWGPSPDFYLDAHRRPASRYSSTFPLTGFIFGSALSWDPTYDLSPRIHAGAWEQLDRELEDARPKVLVDEFTFRGGGKYALAQYPYLRTLVANEYELAREYPEALVYVRRDTDRTTHAPTSGRVRRQPRFSPTNVPR
jgi:4-amino-4-deoxy-L-arabinose transferase-like glycosyltransferase